MFNNNRGVLHPVPGGQAVLSPVPGGQAVLSTTVLDNIVTQDDSTWGAPESGPSSTHSQNPTANLSFDERLLDSTRIYNSENDLEPLDANNPGRAMMQAAIDKIQKFAICRQVLQTAALGMVSPFRYVTVLEPGTTFDVFGQSASGQTDKWPDDREPRRVRVATGNENSFNSTLLHEYTHLATIVTYAHDTQPMTRSLMPSWPPPPPKSSNGTTGS